MAPFPVVDMSSGRSFHWPILPDATGRYGRESWGKHRDTGASPCGRSGVPANDRQELQQEDSTDLDAGDGEKRFGIIEATANGRLAHANVGLPTPDRVESVSGESSPGMDDAYCRAEPVGVGRQERTTSKQRRGCHLHNLSRHHQAPAVEKPCDSNKQQTRRRCLSVAVHFLCAQGWRAYHLQRHHLFHRLRPRVGRRNLQRFEPRKWIESVSLEDSFSMWDAPADQQPEKDFLLEQLQSPSSSGITGQKALIAILQLYPDQQQKIVANRVERLQATMAQK